MTDLIVAVVCGGLGGILGSLTVLGIWSLRK